MSTSLDFVGTLMQTFSSALLPFNRAIRSSAAMSAFLAEFGWNLDPSSNSSSTIVGIFKDVDDSVNALAKASAELDAVAAGDDAALASALGDLALALGAAIEAIHGLVGRSEQPTWPVPLNVAGFWSTFPLEVLDHLVYHGIRSSLPKLYGVLRFLGVLTRDWTVPTAANRQPYYKLGVQWDLLAAVVARPRSLFPTVYGWGSTFDHVRFSTNVQELLWGFGLPGRGNTPTDPVLLAPYYDPASSVVDEIIQLDAPLVYGLETIGSLSALQTVRLIILPIPPAGSKTGVPSGFTVFPLAEISGAGSFTVSDFATLTISGGLETAPVRLDIRPDSVSVATDLTGTKISTKAEIEIAPEQALILFGAPQGTRLELAKAHFAVAADISASQREYKLEFGLDSMAFVIDFSKSDGFLKTILGSQPQKLDMAVSVAYSNISGFGIRGQAQLEASLPVHLAIAEVLTVDTIYIALRAATDGSGLALVVAATGGLQIGPVDITVDRVGLELDLKPIPAGQAPGNLGDLTMAFGFKPPSGLGLLIDAGVVVGGGYIFCDPSKGQYAGVLELSAEALQIKVIGILNTILPGGQQGYSLLLIVSADFEPIQLGFGFTLNGVGGLAGVNRTMVLDALRDGLKHHTLNSILFPVDPIEHAPQIISDLQTVFPPQQGRYVFGPMLELGWGVPSLIIAELGIVLELPAPVRLAILGQMRAALPEDALAIVLIHLDVLGTVDFEKQLLTIDATLYDSRVTVYTLIGDMAMRLLWGKNSNFALAVGGFNPKFQPPPGFPSLARLTLSMGNGDNPRLSYDAYFAVTSNTVQFGAGVAIHAAAGGFSVDGHLSFDALFVLSPFHFTVEISGGVDLKAGGSTLMSIGLDLVLEGPNPWHVAGTASVSFWFFSVRVHFDATFGDANQVSLPGKDPTTPLLNALNDPRSWSAGLPADAERGVSVIAPSAQANTIVLHPLGLLGVSQKVLPLNFHLARFGSSAPLNVDQFDIGTITLNGQSVTADRYALLKDNFAPGQFEDLSDNDKLTRPSFEQLVAGVQFSDGEAKAGTVQQLDIEYETFLIDDPLLPSVKQQQTHKLSASSLAAMAKQGGSQLSPLRNTGKRKYVDPSAADGSVQLGQVSYVVASKNDLGIRSDISDGSGSSYAAASQRLAQYSSANPSEAASLQIVAVHEVAA